MSRTVRARLATDDFPNEPAEVARCRALARAVIGQAIYDLKFFHWDAVRRDALLWLFDDTDPDVVAARAFWFDLADMNLRALREFLHAADLRRAQRFARSIMPSVSGVSGG